MATKTATATFEALWAKATAAADAAAAAVRPTGMVVQQRVNPLNDNSRVTKEWVVPEGPCGFGYVNFPGNTAFGRWAKATGRARPDSYAGGLLVSSQAKVNGQWTQSYDRNSAWARAFAKVLTENGIAKAYSHSRLD